MYNIDDIKNTVIHGDSEIELLKIPNESIDCVIIDPPYNLLKHKLDRQFNRELIYKELYRVLKNNSFLVVFGSGLQLCKDIVMLNKIGFEVKEEVIWVKDNTTNFMGNLPRRHESFYILSKGNKSINKSYIDYFEKCINENSIEKLFATYKDIYNALQNKEKIELIKNKLYNGIVEYTKHRIERKVIRCDKMEKQLDVSINSLNRLLYGAVENTVFFVKRDSKYEHDTKKPLELMSRIVKLVSNENDIILDCFAGSGSTLLGAIKNDRQYIGIEIDKEYYDICCNRIKEKQGLFLGA